MKLSKRGRKIIAREFLTFLASALLIFSIIGIFNLFNNINREQEEQIIVRLDELKRYPDEVPYRIRIYFFLNDEILHPYQKIKKVDVFIDKLKSKKESKNTYELIENKVGLNYSFEEFFASCIADNESESYWTENKIEIQKLEQELIDKRYEFFSKSLDDDTLLKIIISMFTISFILRYIYYATKWSLKNIR